MDENEIADLINRSFEVHAAAEMGRTGALLAAFDSVAKSVKTYTFKSRVKSARAIELKVRRKRAAGRAAMAELDAVAEGARDASWTARREQAGRDASYTVDHLTDVLGLRFVTLYQSEIPLIVEELLKALAVYNQDQSNSLVDATEFVIYTSRPPGDPLSIVDATRDAVERSPLFSDVAAKIRPPESRKSAYSSVHFVFKHDVTIQHPGKEEGEETVFFEVQIRDIFEEGWGEVQHHLLYSEKDGPAGGRSEPADERRWVLHLNALKTAVDGCSQHASIIKSDLDAQRTRTTPLAIGQSVSDRPADLAKVLASLRATAATGDKQKLVAKGYNLLISADEIPGEPERLARLDEAAANLDEALRKLSSRQRDARQKGETLTAGYYVQMEAAAARTLGAALSCVSPEEAARRRLEAERMYGELMARFPADPTVRMRLGQVIDKRAVGVDDLLRAEALFDDAIRLIPADPSTGDDHWMAISARVDKGYSIWRRGELSDDPEVVLRSLADAAAATTAALDVWRGQITSGKEVNRVMGHKAASNIVYYLAQIAEKGGELAAARRDQLRATVEHLEANEPEPYADWFKTRDNLLHAYRVLGRPDRVGELAKANFLELRQRAEERAGGPLDAGDVRNHLAGSPLRCFETAREALAASATPPDAE